MSEPFSLMPTDCPICSLLSLSPSPWSASVHLSISCHLSFVPWCLSLCLPHCLCLLPSLWILPSPSCSLSCLLLSPPSVPSACFPLAGPERGVPAPRAPCHPPWLSQGRPPRSPNPALHPLALPSPPWGDSGVTGKKVKGAGGGGWGKGFFFKKNQKVINNMQPRRRRQQTPPGPSPQPGPPGWRGRSQSPSPPTLRPPKKKKSPRYP
uniref:Uncharacterized protein n=1 Tax=Sus scrofa TaxID=9823 RepID=A0A8D0TWX4_PIG